MTIIFAQQVKSNDSGQQQYDPYSASVGEEVQSDSATPKSTSQVSIQ